MAIRAGGPQNTIGTSCRFVDFKNAGHSMIGRAKLAAHAIYSRLCPSSASKNDCGVSPDVAHVRNIYHQLSPSILWELKAQNVPSSITLMISSCFVPATTWCLTGMPVSVA